MRRLVWFVMLLMLTWLLPNSAQGSDAQDPLIVAFVGGHDAGGYRLNDVSGFSRFTVLINNAGGIVREIQLDELITQDVDVLVLHGPKRPALSGDEVARIWAFLDRGGNLLVLNDAPPNAGLPARSPLNDLLWEDYGIRWSDTIVVQQNFSPEATQAISSRGYRTQPRRLSGLAAEPMDNHPVTQSLITYDLPVYFWHARTLELQAPSLKGDPVPLLQTAGPNLFGEARLPRDGLPVFNIGQDAQGILVIGAAVEDIDTGARIVVVTDSDAFKNGYGLEYLNNYGQLPLFAGNDLFAKAVIKWLVDQPLGDIALDQRYTWIAVDGDLSEWISITPVIEAVDLGQIRIVQTDLRHYFSFSQLPTQLESITMQISNNVGESLLLSIILREGSLEVSIGGDTVAGTIGGVSDSIEVSIPVTALPSDFTITGICTVATTLNCTDIDVTQIRDIGLEPRGRGLLPGVRTARLEAINGIALRSEPSFESSTIMLANFSALVNILGHDTSGNWVEVWLDGLTGWLPVESLEFAFVRTEQ